MIYMDNGATTAKKPQKVIDAICNALKLGEYGNPSRGSHDAALNAFRKVYGAREKAASFFGVSDPLKVAFCFNATDGLNRVIKGYLEPKDHVITTVTEHNSVLRPLYDLEKLGLEISTLKLKDEVLDIEPLESLIKDNTKAIIVNLASNVTGDIAPIEKISEIAKRRNITLICDGSQIAGQRKISLKDMGIDVLVTTGHKSLYGPTGTGLILVEKDLEFKPVLSGGAGFHSFDKNHPKDFPDVFESGTLNLVGILGLEAGMDYLIEKDLEEVEKRLKSITSKFINGLKNIEGIKIYGNPDGNRTATVAITLKDISSSELAGILNDDYSIAVRPGAHCAPRLHEALGTKDDGLTRFSFSLFNTDEEIEKAISALKEISDKYGSN